MAKKKNLTPERREELHKLLDGLMDDKVNGLYLVLEVTDTKGGRQVQGCEGVLNLSMEAIVTCVIDAFDIGVEDLIGYTLIGHGKAKKGKK
jgi:hypothetical protein